MDSKIVYNKHDGQRFCNGLMLTDRYHYLGESEKLPFELNCTHAVHWTENDVAGKIGFDKRNIFCFKTGQWKPSCDSEQVFKFLTWWSPLPPENWDKNIKKDDMGSEFKDHFCKSPAFNGRSLCGPIGFVISWSNILDEYAKSRGKNCSKIELKYFGTFMYRREIMYAILICCKGDKIFFKKNGKVREFSVIEKESETFGRIKDDKSFIWKVRSTTAGWSPSGPIPRHRDPSWDSWDHVAFALYFPKEDQPLNIDPKYCEIKTKNATSYRPVSRSYSWNRGFDEIIPDEKIVKKLNKKIEENQAGTSKIQKSLPRSSKSLPDIL